MEKKMFEKCLLYLANNLKYCNNCKGVSLWLNQAQKIFLAKTNYVGI